MSQSFPANFERLAFYEGDLRRKAISLIAGNERLGSHVTMVEKAMIVAEKFSQLDDADEDLKVVQLLAVRSFNTFATAMKLALEGYAQNCALVLRDILETVFLIELFAGDRSLIERYRSTEQESRMAQFSPAALHGLLDARDGSTGQGRRTRHDFYSELACHPATQAALVDRSMRNGNLSLGPQFDGNSVDMVLFEMARLADQVGELLDGFFPVGATSGLEARFALKKERLDRMQKFHSTRMPPGHKPM